MAKISVLLVLALAARLPAGSPDPREIVKRSIAAEIENSKRAKNYTFLQRNEDRTLDAAGRVKWSRSLTYDVTMLEGSAYRRLIERDDRRLSPRRRRRSRISSTKAFATGAMRARRSMMSGCRRTTTGRAGTGGC